MQNATRWIHCEDTHKLLQRLSVNAPFDRIVICIVECQLHHGGHRLYARRNNLGLEVQVRGAEEHPRPQRLCMHHLSQALTLAAASCNNGKLKEVLTEVCGLVGELHLQGVVGLYRDLVHLRVRLLVLILVPGGSQLSRSLRPTHSSLVHCRGGSLGLCDSTNGQLILLQGDGLKSCGIIVRIKSLVSLFQQGQAELRIWLQIDIMGSLHCRGILQRDGHNALRPQRELSKLNLVLHKLNVGIHSGGHDGEANRLASAHVERHG
mmetsp:Transcript_13778/g.32684  ORF Transcript_13778/g.32684 Transcript_13778/m.32684 type:complete len:264 (-) Transcript_13778:2904-3695(-)